MVQSEGNMSLKNPVTPPGIDPRTVQLVVHCLNHYATPGPVIPDNTEDNLGYHTTCHRTFKLIRGLYQKSKRTVRSNFKVLKSWAPKMTSVNVQTEHYVQLSGKNMQSNGWLFNLYSTCVLDAGRHLKSPRARGSYK